MSNLTGTDKSVILLMTIGEDRAAEVFKHLSQREVQTLSAAMANVTQISNKQLTDVLAEFEQEAELNRPGFPGECFICELRLPDHRFRWK
ncbi:hypothetical protein ACQ9A1_24485, partial [Escherichia coli]